MTDLHFVSGDAIDAAELHACMTLAFSDYIVGPFMLPLAQWPFFLARHGVDLSLSRVAMRSDEALAFALVAPRAPIGHWRLATMGAVPQARGTGAAPMLLDDFIARARQAGMRGVELECIAQNDRALRLYRKRGFVEISPLVGYVRAADDDARVSTTNRDADIDAVSLDDAFAWLDAIATQRGDLPLQVTSQSLRALPVAPIAWRHGDALLVFSETTAETVTVQSIVDTNPALFDAQFLIEQMAARYAQRRITAPQLHRPDIGGDAFERAGFERLPLHQFLMRRRV